MSNRSMTKFIFFSLMGNIWWPKNFINLNVCSLLIDDKKKFSSRNDIFGDKFYLRLGHFVTISQISCSVSRFFAVQRVEFFFSQPVEHIYFKLLVMLVRLNIFLNRLNIFYNRLRLYKIQFLNNQTSMVSLVLDK